MISYIEDKQWVLRRHDHRWEIAGYPRRLLMPPFVTTLRPRNIVSSAPENNDVLDMRALLESRIDDGLGRDRLPATAPFVRSEDHAALAVIDTVAKSLRRETGKDDRVDSTDAGTS